MHFLSHDVCDHFVLDQKFTLNLSGIHYQEGYSNQHQKKKKKKILKECMDFDSILYYIILPHWDFVCRNDNLKYSKLNNNYESILRSKIQKRKNKQYKQSNTIEKGRVGSCTEGELLLRQHAVVMTTMIK